jgi:hypothetical protein
VFVVYSAIYGMTDAFLNTLEKTSCEASLDDLQLIFDRYNEITGQLQATLGEPLYQQLVDQIDSRFSQVRVWLAAFLSARGK